MHNRNMNLLFSFQTLLGALFVCIFPRCLCMFFLSIPLCSLHSLQHNSIFRCVYFLFRLSPSFRHDILSTTEEFFCISCIKSIIVVYFAFHTFCIHLCDSLAIPTTAGSDCCLNDDFNGICYVCATVKL